MSGSSYSAPRTPFCCSDCAIGFIADSVIGSFATRRPLQTIRSPSRVSSLRPFLIARIRAPKVKGAPIRSTLTAPVPAADRRQPQPQRLPRPARPPRRRQGRAGAAAAGRLGRAQAGRLARCLPLSHPGSLAASALTPRLTACVRSHCLCPLSLPHCLQASHAPHTAPARR